MDAGALNFLVWDKLVETKKIDPSKVAVFWTTPPYVDYVWTAHAELDPGLRERITQAFLRLRYENPEDVNAQPLEALQAGGAPRSAILLYGVLPQAWPQFLAYALYRWEVNVRAAAVLGFVGAGGLGQRIHIAISLFLEHQLLTLILTIYLMVTVVDALSGWLRRRAI